MFQIGLPPTKEDSVRFPIYYDKDGHVKTPEDGSHPKDGGGNDAEFMTFYLVPLKGRAHRKIADAMMEMDQKKNRSKLRTGTAVMERIKNCVFEIEGLEFNGTEVKRITDPIYMELPSWVINELAEKIGEINGDIDDEDDETGE